MNRSKWKEKALKSLENLSDCSFDNFKIIHKPPYRSLNSGAPGIAYTFWKAACLLEDPRWLHLALFWTNRIAATPEDDSSIKLPEAEGAIAEIDVENSFYHGNRGVHFVEMLTTYAQNDVQHFEIAMNRFAKPETKKHKIQDLLQGRAGRLVGSTILYRETGEDFFVEYGNEIAESLIESAGIPESNVPWGTNPLLGMAHGRAGNYYALLFWAKASGFELPDWFKEKTMEFAESGIEREHGISWPIDVRNSDNYMDSWCNGAPGMLHLWTLAYELYREELFLDTARKTGEYCIHKEDYPLGHLCCGASGASYGLLSLDRIDPDGPWLDHAERFAEMASTAKFISIYQLGLYTGLSGLTCLMLDMAHHESAAQPAFFG